MGFFEVSFAARRRARIRAELPTMTGRVLLEMDALADALPDPAGMGPDEMAGSMAAVSRLRNRLDAYLVHIAGAADASGASQTLRAGTTGTLVAAATGSTPQAGSAIVKLARELRGLPEVDAAFTAGDISSMHAAVIAENAQAIPNFRSIEHTTAQVAAEVDPVSVRHVLQTIADAHNPAKPDLDTAEQRARRSLRLSARPSGMWRISGLLTDIDGAALADVLASFTAEPDPDSSPEQRRADALADVASAAAANTRPLGVSGVSVLVDIDNMPDSAVLADGTRLSAAHYELLSCAAVCTVIFGRRAGSSFVPLALGRTARRASAAQWAALIARDRGCIRCGRTPRFCHAHHIIGWAAGGLTDLENLALLCSRCHHDLHHGRYTIAMDPDCLPKITPTTRAPPIPTAA